MNYNHLLRSCTAGGPEHNYSLCLIQFFDKIKMSNSLLFWVCSVGAAAAAAKPNIIFVVIDKYVSAGTVMPVWLVALAELCGVLDKSTW